MWLSERTVLDLSQKRWEKMRTGPWTWHSSNSSTLRVATLLPPTHKWHQRAIDANHCHAHGARGCKGGGLAAQPGLGRRSQHLPLGLTLLQMLASNPHSKTLPFLQKGSSATHESQQPESNSPSVPARWKAPNLRQIFCQTSPGILQSHLPSCNRSVVK